MSDPLDAYWTHLEAIKQRFPEGLPSGFNPSVEEVWNLLCEGVIEKAKALMPHVAARTGVDAAVLQERLTGVRVIEVPEVNCGVYSQDGWRTFQIGINLGLMMFPHPNGRTDLS